MNPFSNMKYTNVDDSHFDPHFYSNTVPTFGLKGGRKTKRRKRSLRKRKSKSTRNWFN
jgi:hypothetical protein